MGRQESDVAPVASAFVAVAIAAFDLGLTLLRRRLVRRRLLERLEAELEAKLEVKDIIAVVEPSLVDLDICRVRAGNITSVGRGRRSVLLTRSGVRRDRTMDGGGSGVGRRSGTGSGAGGADSSRQVGRVGDGLGAAGLSVWLGRYMCMCMCMCTWSWTCCGRW